MTSTICANRDRVKSREEYVNGDEIKIASPHTYAMHFDFEYCSQVPMRKLTRATVRSPRREYSIEWSSMSFYQIVDTISLTFIGNQNQNVYRKKSFSIKIRPFLGSSSFMNSVINWSQLAGAFFNIYVEIQVIFKYVST